MADRHKTPRDLNRLARQIVDEATGEAPAEDEGKDPAPVALGRKGAVGPR